MRYGKDRRKSSLKVSFYSWFLVTNCGLFPHKHTKRGFVMLSEFGINQRNLTQAEMIDALEWDDGKFSNRFARFCSLYNFSETDFKENGTFIFRKEWNGIFFVLMQCLTEHPMFDRRKPSIIDNLGAIITYNDALLSPCYLNGLRTTNASPTGIAVK